MVTMYKDGEACTVGYDQMDIMRSVGWSTEKDKVMPEAEKAAQEAQKLALKKVK